VSRGATEDLVAKLADYEASDLPERSKAALRLADRLAGDRPRIDAEFQAMLARHFTGDELIDLGMTLTFASGWQRFIEAFGIVPDRWREGAPPPFRALVDEAPPPHERKTPWPP
jgi:alkylhydroperoxidase family enzyme